MYINRKEDEQEGLDRKMHSVLKIVLGLDDGVKTVYITPGEHNTLPGWWLSFDDGPAAFVRYAHGQWRQRLTDKLSANDLQKITSAMEECCLNI